MSNELTYMDCWHFIAPLIPVNSDYTMDIYVMVFNASGRRGGGDKLREACSIAGSKSPAQSAGTAPGRY